MKYETGVIHGRFQALHEGHMEYLLAGKSRCEFLFIGITNSDPHLTSENGHDLNRSTVLANPFTYYERLEMLRDAMLENGIERNAFEIVPFPINFPELIRYYVPLDAVFFVTIYDEWGKHKLETLMNMGLRTEVMWERSVSERLTSGSEIRNLIATNKEWEHLVPKSVAKYIKEKHLSERLRTA